MGPIIMGNVIIIMGNVIIENVIMRIGIIGLVIMEIPESGTVFMGFMIMENMISYYGKRDHLNSYCRTFDYRERDYDIRDSAKHDYGKRGHKTSDYEKR